MYIDWAEVCTGKYLGLGKSACMYITTLWRQFAYVALLLSQRIQCTRENSHHIVFKNSVYSR